MLLLEAGIIFLSVSHGRIKGKLGEGGGFVKKKKVKMVYTSRDVEVYRAQLNPHNQRGILVSDKMMSFEVLEMTFR